MGDDSRRRTRVLVVEDDPAMRDSYGRFFRELHPDEFAATLVADGEQALAVLRSAPIDVLVLDWNLPRITGPALAKALRSQARTKSIGIIMVTALGGAPATVSALDSGADDFIAKPFDWSVLLARLRSLIRRSDDAASQRLRKLYPGLELDVSIENIVVDGRSVRLSPKESELFRILLTRPDMVHSRRFLWDAAWGVESEGWEHTLAVTVSSLRKKLGPRWGPRLEVRRRIGYCFLSEP
jgi:two-component system phosphate regulon response regulator PhoB